MEMEIPEWLREHHRSRVRRDGSILFLDASDGTETFDLGSVIRVAGWSRDFWVYFSTEQERVTEEVFIPFREWQAVLRRGPLHAIRTKMRLFVPWESPRIVGMQLQFSWNLFIPFGQLESGFDRNLFVVRLLLGSQDIVTLRTLFGVAVSYPSCTSNRLYG
jgi:hypothetical protein